MSQGLSWIRLRSAKTDIWTTAVEISYDCLRVQPLVVFQDQAYPPVWKSETSHLCGTPRKCFAAWSTVLQPMLSYCPWCGRILSTRFPSIVIYCTLSAEAHDAPQPSAKPNRTSGKVNPTWKGDYLIVHCCWDKWHWRTRRTERSKLVWSSVCLLYFWAVHLKGTGKGLFQIVQPYHTHPAAYHKCAANALFLYRHQYENIYTWHHSETFFYLSNVRASMSSPSVIMFRGHHKNKSSVSAS